MPWPHMVGWCAAFAAQQQQQQLLQQHTPAPPTVYRRFVCTGEQFMSMFDDYDEQAAKKPKQAPAAAANSEEPSEDDSSSAEGSSDDRGSSDAGGTFLTVCTFVNMPSKVTVLVCAPKPAVVPTITPCSGILAPRPAGCRHFHHAIHPRILPELFNQLVLHFCMQKKETLKTVSSSEQRTNLRKHLQLLQQLTASWRLSCQGARATEASKQQHQSSLVRNS